MNRDRIIHATTVVAMGSMGLLLYWVFAFSCVTIFGLKVFRENITQAFGLSILGILALLAGSLIVNTIFNLSKIADSLSSPEKGGSQSASAGFPTNAQALIILALFPAIAGGLFLGDRLTTRNREKYLTEAAETLIRDNPKEIAALSSYSFSKQYIDKAGQILAVLSRTRESAPRVQVIVQDTSESTPLILAFEAHESWRDNKNPKRSDFIYSSSTEELEYLRGVFAGGGRKHRFSASDGTYELYFPVTEGGRTAVMYFSDRKEYGKIGS